MSVTSGLQGNGVLAGKGNIACPRTSEWWSEKVKASGEKYEDRDYVRSKSSRLSKGKFPWESGLRKTLEIRHDRHGFWIGKTATQRLDSDNDNDVVHYLSEEGWQVFMSRKLAEIEYILENLGSFENLKNNKTEHYAAAAKIWESQKDAFLNQLNKKREDVESEGFSKWRLSLCFPSIREKAFKLTRRYRYPPQIPRDDVCPDITSVQSENAFCSAKSSNSRSIYSEITNWSTNSFGKFCYSLFGAGRLASELKPYYMKVMNRRIGTVNKWKVKPQMGQNKIQYYHFLWGIVSNSLPRASATNSTSSEFDVEGVMPIWMIVIGIFLFFSTAKLAKTTLSITAMSLTATLSYFIFLNLTSSVYALIYAGCTGLVAGALALKMIKVPLVALAGLVGFVVWVGSKEWYRSRVTEAIMYTIAGILVLSSIMLALHYEKQWIIFFIPFIGAVLLSVGLLNILDFPVYVYPLNICDWEDCSTKYTLIGVFSVISAIFKVYLAKKKKKKKITPRRTGDPPLIIHPLETGATDTSITGSSINI